MQINLKFLALLALLLIASTTALIAQEVETDSVKKHTFFSTNIDYQIKAQFSIGGASPLGFPSEIRKIESYNPTLQLGIGVNATKWFTDRQKLGLRVGITFEGKCMKTQAKVKNYYTQIEDNTGAQTRGYFTGHVTTNMKNSYLTVPISLVWNASKSWNFYGGFYFSALLEKSFSGYIYNGNFREGTPVGELTVFENSTHGIYDFSSDLNGFQWGNQLGAELKLKTNFNFFVDVTMGNLQIFNSDFEAISFKMYTIYANIGFAYTFY